MAAMHVVASAYVSLHKAWKMKLDRREVAWIDAQRDTIWRVRAQLSSTIMCSRNSVTGENQTEGPAASRCIHRPNLRGFKIRQKWLEQKLTVLIRIDRL